jgi:hypothetical protein
MADTPTPEQEELERTEKATAEALDAEAAAKQAAADSEADRLTEEANKRREDIQTAEERRSE